MNDRGPIDYVSQTNTAIGSIKPQPSLRRRASTQSPYSWRKGRNNYQSSAICYVQKWLTQWRVDVRMYVWMYRLSRYIITTAVNRGSV